MAYLEIRREKKLMRPCTWACSERHQLQLQLQLFNWSGSLLACCNLVQLYSFTCKERPNPLLLLHTGWRGWCWGAADPEHAGQHVWVQRGLCCRWRYEVLFVQVLLRAGEEGRIQGAWSERSLLLLKQLQCKKPSFEGHQLRELLLPPRLYVAVAPVDEADLRREKSIPKQQVCRLRKGWLYFQMTLLHVPYFSVGKQQ